MEKASFAWAADEPPCLKNFNLTVRAGQLVAVVGQVGSGKSSLVSALLGEMVRVGGRVNTRGRVAYVPQQAWIQNCTLRDNVTFGKSCDDGRYDQVVEACALKPDLEMLPAGDATEIGEKVPPSERRTLSPLLILKRNNINERGRERENLYSLNEHSRQHGER